MSFGAPKNLRNNIPGIVYPKHSLRTDSSWYMGTWQSIEIQWVLLLQEQEEKLEVQVTYKPSH